MQFHLVLVFLLCSMADRSSDAQQVERYPSFVDVTIQTDVSGEAKSDIEFFLPGFVRHISQQFLTDKSANGTTVCFQLLDRRVEGEISVQDDRAEAAMNHLIDNVVVAKRPKNAICSPKRSNAHQALIKIVKMLKSGRDQFRDQVARAHPNHVDELQRRNLTALVVLGQFKPTRIGWLGYGPWYECILGINDHQRQCRDDQLAYNADVVKNLVDNLWGRLQNVLDHCTYVSTEGRICYYDEKKICATDVNVTRHNIGVRYTQICGESWNRRNSCVNEVCDAECEQRLDNATCLSKSDFSPGIKSLAIDGDQFTKHCKVQKKACNVSSPLCHQTSPSPSPSPSPSQSQSTSPQPTTKPPAKKMPFQAKVGLALLGIGLALFFFGGVGGLVIACISGARNNQKKTSDLPKSLIVKKGKKKVVTEVKK